MAESVDPTESLKSQKPAEGGGVAGHAPNGGSWENFSHWLCAVCVVTFDLELGQALEVCACPTSIRQHCCASVSQLTNRPNVGL